MRKIQGVWTVFRLAIRLAEQVVGAQVSVENKKGQPWRLPFLLADSAELFNESLPTFPCLSLIWKREECL